MIQRENRNETKVDLVRNTARVQIQGFFAYLALTPAIFCFGLLLLVVFVMTWQGFQQPTDSVLNVAMAVFSKLNELFPLLKSLVPDLSKLVDESGVIEINNNNLAEIIFKLYGWVALPFVVLGLLKDIVKGPGAPRPLARKIKLLAYATLAVVGLLFLNVLIGSGVWSGSLLAWFLMFTIGPGIVFLISASSLCVHHLILTSRFET